MPYPPLTYSAYRVSPQIIRKHLIRWPSVICSPHILPGFGMVGLAVFQNLILEAVVLTGKDEFGSSISIFKELDSMSQRGQSFSHIQSVT
jgi:hypothetical protein